MKKIIILAFIFCFCGMYSVVDVYADSPAPQDPYKIELQNGQKIFYMTLKGEENESALETGLYLNTTPPENIYLLDKYIYENDLYLSGDGIYLAHIDGWPSIPNSNSESDVGNLIPVEFYENGECINKYAVSYLMNDTSKGVRSVSHFQWDSPGERKFDASKNTLSILTKDNMSISFDITTGTIISKEFSFLPAVSSEITRLFIIAAGVIIIAAAIIIIKRMRQR